MEQRYRIVFEVSERTRKRFDQNVKALGHGMGTALMQVITDELLDCIEQHPRGVVGFILAKQLHILDVCPSVKEAIEAKERVKKKGGINGHK